MSLEIITILWKPGLVGLVVLAIGAIAGWGMSQTEDFVLSRLMRWWVLKIIVPLLKRPSWVVRSGAIFVNNATICAMIIVAGRFPTGAWVAVTAAGLAMGAAVRVLQSEFGSSVDEKQSLSATRDVWFQVGLCLNMIELPAIFLTLALSMGQLAIPVAMPELWQIGGYWVIPMLAIAAAGEGLWMGRQGIFEN